MNYINLRKLEYFPKENPYLTIVSNLRTSKKIIKTRSARQPLMYRKTKELIEMPIIHTIEERSEEHFLYYFSQAVKATFDLSLTGYRVFIEVLKTYQNGKLINDRVESVNLIMLNKTLNGTALNMSNRTYYNGLKELIAKGFLKPKMPNHYWVNPSIFFDNDRFIFLREYRKKILSPV